MVVWAVVVSAPLLDFDPTKVPRAIEWQGSIHHYHFWSRVSECGACALWWGNSEGGNPAFGDPVGHILDPWVALPTLALGVVNGSKVATAGAFVTAGIAQWWLAWALGLGPAARLWSAVLAVVGGHLGWRIAFGPHMVLSIAFCALATAAIVGACRHPTRRRMVALGGALGAVGLGGLMYPQVGLACAAPAALVYLPREAPWTLLRRLGVAAVLGFLLAAPYLVPFLRFMPMIAKEYDIDFRGVTTVGTVTRSLVIDDETVYAGQALGAEASIYRNANFLGFTPLALGACAVLAAVAGSRRRDVLFLLAAAAVPLFLSTGLLLEWLAGLAEDPQIARRLASIRFPALIGPVALPPLIGLAAIGLQRLIDLPWPRWRRRPTSGSNVGRRALQHAFASAADARWLLLLPALYAVAAARSFNTEQPKFDRIPPATFSILEALRPDDLQWVAFPFGQSVFILPAAELNLKQHKDVVYRSWEWGFRPAPEPARVATTPPGPDGFTRIAEVLDHGIYQAPPGSEYAAITHADGSRTVCSARGVGGRLDVECPPVPAGMLTVKENSASGWKAEVDGRRTELAPDRWLALELPEGARKIALRYRPWDVALGIVCFAVGLGIAGWWWRSPGPRSAAAAGSGSARFTRS